MNSFGWLGLAAASAWSMHADQTAKGKTTHRKIGMIHLQNLPHLHNDRDAIEFRRRTLLAYWFPRCEPGESFSSRISPAARMRSYAAKRSASAKRPQMDGTLADQRRQELNTGKVCSY